MANQNQERCDHGKNECCCQLHAEIIINRSSEIIIEKSRKHCNSEISEFQKNESSYKAYTKKCKNNEDSTFETIINKEDCYKSEHIYPPNCSESEEHTCCDIVAGNNTVPEEDKIDVYKVINKELKTRIKDVTEDTVNPVTKNSSEVNVLQVNREDSLKLNGKSKSRSLDDKKLTKYLKDDENVEIKNLKPPESITKQSKPAIEQTKNENVEKVNNDSHDSEEHTYKRRRVRDTINRLNKLSERNEENAQYDQKVKRRKPTDFKLRSDVPAWSYLDLENEHVRSISIEPERSHANIETVNKTDNRMKVSDAEHLDSIGAEQTDRKSEVEPLEIKDKSTIKDQSNDERIENKQDEPILDTTEAFKESNEKIDMKSEEVMSDKITKDQRSKSNSKKKKSNKEKKIANKNVKKDNLDRDEIDGDSGILRDRQEREEVLNHQYDELRKRRSISEEIKDNNAELIVGSDIPPKNMVKSIVQFMEMKHRELSEERNKSRDASSEPKERIRKNTRDSSRDKSDDGMEKINQKEKLNEIPKTSIATRTNMMEGDVNKKKILDTMADSSGDETDEEKENTKTAGELKGFNVSTLMKKFQNDAEELEFDEKDQKSLKEKTSNEFKTIDDTVVLGPSSNLMDEKEKNQENESQPTSDDIDDNEDDKYHSPKITLKTVTHTVNTVMHSGKLDETLGTEIQNIKNKSSKDTSVSETSLQSDSANDKANIIEDKENVDIQKTALENDRVRIDMDEDKSSKPNEYVEYIIEVIKDPLNLSSNTNNVFDQAIRSHNEKNSEMIQDVELRRSLEEMGDVTMIDENVMEEDETLPSLEKDSTKDGDEKTHNEKRVEGEMKHANEEEDEAKSLNSHNTEMKDGSSSNEKGHDSTFEEIEHIMKSSEILKEKIIEDVEKKSKVQNDSDSKKDYTNDQNKDHTILQKTYTDSKASKKEVHTEKLNCEKTIISSLISGVEENLRKECSEEIQEYSEKSSRNEKEIKKVEKHYENKTKIENRSREYHGRKSISSDEDEEKQNQSHTNLKEPEESKDTLEKIKIERKIEHSLDGTEMMEKCLYQSFEIKSRNNTRGKTESDSEERLREIIIPTTQEEENLKEDEKGIDQVEENEEEKEIKTSEEGRLPNTKEDPVKLDMKEIKDHGLDEKSVKNVSELVLNTTDVIKTNYDDVSESTDGHSKTEEVNYSARDDKEKTNLRESDAQKNARIDDTVIVESLPGNMCQNEGDDRNSTSNFRRQKRSQEGITKRFEEPEKGRLENLVPPKENVEHDEGPMEEENIEESVDLEMSTDQDGRKNNFDLIESPIEKSTSNDENEGLTHNNQENIDESNSSDTEHTAATEKRKHDDIPKNKTTIPQTTIGDEKTEKENLKSEVKSIEGLTEEGKCSIEIKDNSENPVSKDEIHEVKLGEPKSNVGGIHDVYEKQIEHNMNDIKSPVQEESLASKEEIDTNTEKILSNNENNNEVIDLLEASEESKGETTSIHVEQTAPDSTEDSGNEVDEQKEQANTNINDDKLNGNSNSMEKDEKNKATAIVENVQPRQGVETPLLEIDNISHKNEDHIIILDERNDHVNDYKLEEESGEKFDKKPEDLILKDQKNFETIVIEEEEIPRKENAEKFDDMSSETIRKDIRPKSSGIGTSEILEILEEENSHIRNIEQNNQDPINNHDTFKEAVETVVAIDSFVKNDEENQKPPENMTRTEQEKNSSLKGEISIDQIDDTPTVSERNISNPELTKNTPENMSDDGDKHTENLLEDGREQVENESEVNKDFTGDIDDNKRRISNENLLLYDSTSDKEDNEANGKKDNKINDGDLSTAIANDPNTKKTKRSTSKEIENPSMDVPIEKIISEDEKSIDINEFDEKSPEERQHDSSDEQSPENNEVHDDILINKDQLSREMDNMVQKPLNNHNMVAHIADTDCDKDIKNSEKDDTITDSYSRTMLQEAVGVNDPSDLNTNPSIEHEDMQRQDNTTSEKYYDISEFISRERLFDVQENDSIEVIKQPDSKDCSAEVENVKDVTNLLKDQCEKQQHSIEDQNNKNKVENVPSNTIETVENNASKTSCDDISYSDETQTSTKECNKNVDVLEKNDEENNIKVLSNSKDKEAFKDDASETNETEINKIHEEKDYQSNFMQKSSLKRSNSEGFVDKNDVFDKSSLHTKVNNNHTEHELKNTSDERNSEDEKESISIEKSWNSEKDEMKLDISHTFDETQSKNIHVVAQDEDYPNISVQIKISYNTAEEKGSLDQKFTLNNKENLTEGDSPKPPSQELEEKNIDVKQIRDSSVPKADIKCLKKSTYTGIEENLEKDTEIHKNVLKKKTNIINDQNLLRNKDSKVTEVVKKIESFDTVEDPKTDQSIGKLTVKKHTMREIKSFEYQEIYDDSKENVHKFHKRRAGRKKFNKRAMKNTGNDNSSEDSKQTDSDTSSIEHELIITEPPSKENKDGVEWRLEGMPIPSNANPNKSRSSYLRSSYYNAADLCGKGLAEDKMNNETYQMNLNTYQEDINIKNKNKPIQKIKNKTKSCCYNKMFVEQGEKKCAACCYVEDSRPLFITTVKKGMFLEPPPEIAAMLGLSAKENMAESKKNMVYSFSSKPRLCLHKRENLKSELYKG